jgi:hypothetical protein
MRGVVAELAALDCGKRNEREERADGRGDRENRASAWSWGDRIRRIYDDR